jgi:hypothetical protein
VKAALAVFIAVTARVNTTSRTVVTEAELSAATVRVIRTEDGPGTSGPSGRWQWKCAVARAVPRAAARAARPLLRAVAIAFLAGRQLSITDHGASGRFADRSAAAGRDTAADRRIAAGHRSTTRHGGILTAPTAAASVTWFRLVARGAAAGDGNHAERNEDREAERRRVIRHGHSSRSKQRAKVEGPKPRKFRDSRCASPRAVTQVRQITSVRKEGYRNQGVSHTGVEP